MSVKGTIQSEEVITKSGTAKKSGKPYAIREQTIMLTMGNGEVRRFSLTLDDNAQPLPKGNYAPGPNAAFLDGYDLKISNRARDWLKAA
jgi:hypothetical protein